MNEVKNAAATVPADHPREQERLEALKSYQILDTMQDSDFDQLAQLASTICGTPIAMVSLVDKDRQWFKSVIGVDASETHRNISFCGHAILTDELTEVPDTTKDGRFSANPLVTDDPGLRFYSGVPLVTDSNLPLGTLCVLDTETRTLSEEQKRSLKAIANQVMLLIEAKRREAQLKEANALLEKKNQSLDDFCMRAAHDLKSPLVNVIGMADYLIEDFKGEEVDESRTYMTEAIGRNCRRLSEMIDRMLDFTRSNALVEDDVTVFDTAELLSEIKGLCNTGQNDEIYWKDVPAELTTNRLVLQTIFLNLIGNALKYASDTAVKVRISIREENGVLHCDVEDNGKGVNESMRKKIFAMFETSGSTDRSGNKGTGLGLAMVDRLVRSMSGNIEVGDSELGGARFTFSLHDPQS